MALFIILFPIPLESFFISGLEVDTLLKFVYIMLLTFLNSLAIYLCSPKNAIYSSYLNFTWIESQQAVLCGLLFFVSQYCWWNSSILIIFSSFCLWLIFSLYYFFSWAENLKQCSWIFMVYVFCELLFMTWDQNDILPLSFSSFKNCIFSFRSLIYLILIWGYALRYRSIFFSSQVKRQSICLENFRYSHLSQN